MSQPTGSPEPTPPAASDPQSSRFAELRATLDAVASRPLAEHAETFARVHTGLQAALAEVDGL